ncbi:MAG: hypothetical protein H0V29_11635, partial [Thermoleophilaceae bacterium]|nr:hypothetical protein [Thermoleophilaceae bacterium]
RADVRAYVEAALAGEGRDPSGPPPWRALLERATVQQKAAEDGVADEAKKRLESEPKGRERKALEREFEEAAKRSSRRARTEVLDLGLELAALSFRDLACISEGAGEAVLAVDASPDLARHAHGRDPRRLREAMERCEDTRQSLELNVSEDLALEALGFRLEKLVGSAG